MKVIRLPFSNLNGSMPMPCLARILIMLCLAVPAAAKAADEGETIPLPTPYITYILKPGKETGKEFTLEKTLWREFRFDYDRPYQKPKETVTLRFSLRGGYRPQDILGHDEFEPREAKDVVTGWVPQSSGQFLIFPDQSKEHLPKWIPERTRLIRLPLIKQYGDTVVNAYDLPLGLDRVNKGEVAPIDFNLIPTTTENGKVGVRLEPKKPLSDGVYYAYSLPTDAEKYHGLVHGFLFAVGNPALGAVNGELVVAASKGYLLVDAKTANDVMDYALLSDAVYDKSKSVKNWKEVGQDNCPFDLGLLACSLESVKTGTERKLYGFNAQAYQHKNEKRLVIAFAGTDGLRDLLADYGNAYLNGKPAQYLEALEFARPLIEKYASAGYKIVLTGHSLGGGLASYAALKFSRPSVSAVVFNAAGLSEGLATETTFLRDSWISEIKRKMNEGLSAEFQYLSETLEKLVSDAKLGINIASVTNIHLVGEPLALFPGQQAGVFYILTVPSPFVWYDNDGKQVQKFSRLSEFIATLSVFIPKDAAFLPGIDKLIPEGWFASLVGDANYSKMLISDYTKLLADHKGVDVRSLPVEPHFMTNVINALKVKAANK